jgi:hypothetical protein
MMEDIQSEGGGKRLGDSPCLTKTLLPSPIIKSILSANIRTPNSNDVIFIKVYPVVATYLQDHIIELYSLSHMAFVLESSIPVSGRIRAAERYIRPQKDPVLLKATSILANVPYCSEDPPERKERDLLFCTTDTGFLVVVGWDDGLLDAEGQTLIKPGLKAFSLIAHVKLGDNVNSLGRFIKISSEYEEYCPYLQS